MQNTSVLCACGCGQLTPLAKATSRRLGLVRGRPTRCLPGHNANRKNRPRKDPATLFASHVAIDSQSGCHIWTGARSSDGYGHFLFAGKIDNAHRVAWLLAGRTIPADKPHVLHRCPNGDRPDCVNIDHLYCGTHDDNMRDRRLAGHVPVSACGLPFGVHRERGGRFSAHIWINKVYHYLGMRDTPEEAGALAAGAKALRDAQP